MDVPDATFDRAAGSLARIPEDKVTMGTDLPHHPVDVAFADLEDAEPDLGQPFSGGRQTLSYLEKSSQCTGPRCGEEYVRGLFRAFGARLVIGEVLGRGCDSQCLISGSRYFQDSSVSSERTNRVGSPMMESSSRRS